MITNDNGSQWPPEDVLQKMRFAAEMRKLYHGEHEEVFGSLEDGRRYITVNYLGALTNLLSWRLFGETFKVSVPDDAPGAQQFCDYLTSHNDLRRKMLDAAILHSYSGECFFKVRYDADKKSIIVNAIDPHRVITATDELDSEQIVSQTVWTILRGSVKTYVWFEQHVLMAGKAYIVNKLYACTEEGGQLFFKEDEDEVDLTEHHVTALLPQVQETGTDSLLVLGIRGSSDYLQTLSIQEEYNNRMSQRAKTLDKFAAPILYGADFEDEDGKTNLEGHVYIKGYSSDQPPFGAFTWDANLKAVDDELRNLREDFAATAGIEMSAILAQEGGGPQSGRAIRLSQMRTQARVLAKQVEFEALLAGLYRVALELATVQGVALDKKFDAPLVRVDKEDVVISFSDGLPTDATEVIEEQGLRVQYRIQSRLDAIKTLDNVSDEEAARKLEQIEREEAGSLHSAFSLNGEPSFNSLLSDNSGGQ